MYSGASPSRLVGFSGSGALSHVYIKHPPLRCNIPETCGLHYDDGNKLLLTATSDQLLSWKIGVSPQLGPPNSDSVGEGPILFVRYSLDRKIIGILRSKQEIQFKNTESGETFTRRCKSDAESILGFFWTDCPFCDVIIIKTSGLDLLMYDAEVNTYRLVETKRFNVSWYRYTHESRMLLLASGSQCSILSGYQFSVAGIVQLPKFEVALAKAEINPKPVQSADDVHIITIYGRIYCLQLDSIAMVLNLYRFYRDAVVQQGSLPIYSSKIAVSVVDNVILVHQVDSKVVILYDIFLDSLIPVSAPLPLLVRVNTNNSRAVDAPDDPSYPYGDDIYAASWHFLIPDLICDVENGLMWRLYLDLEAITASSSDVPAILDFLQRRRSDPCKIKELCLSFMRAIILERRPISTIARAFDVLFSSYSHAMRTGAAIGVERRTPEQIQDSEASTTNVGSNSQVAPSGGFDSEDNSSKNIPVMTSDLMVNMHVRTTQEKMKKKIELNPSTASFGLKADSLDGESMLNSTVSQLTGSQNVTAAVSPDEIYYSVLAHIEDEMTGEYAYLSSIIIELVRCASKEKLMVQPFIFVMLIELLVRTNRFDEIAGFVSNKIIEPSKEVAKQLLNMGNLQTRKLGMEMLRQLDLHPDYVILLLQDGCYLEALRYARKYKVITVQPALFLEAAIAKNNMQHLSAVLRFFCDFTPSFRTSTEFIRCQHILTEMR